MDPPVSGQLSRMLMLVLSCTAVLTADGLSCICGDHTVQDPDGSFVEVAEDLPFASVSNCQPLSLTNRSQTKPPEADVDIGGGIFLAACETDGYCFKSVHRSQAKLTFSYRCIPESLSTPKDRPFMCHASEAKKSEFQNGCCKNGSFCNQNITFELPPPGPQSSSSNRALLIFIAVVIPLALLLLVLAAVLFWWLHYFRKKDMLFPKSANSSSTGPLTETRPILPREDYPLIRDDSQATTIREMLEDTYSGSGSGLPVLVQRSIARQIRLVNVVGQGRFGEVWRGTWRDEEVAVKIFSTRDERSWFRESELYQTVMLRHDNILGFIATDNKDDGTWMQLWLVTEYHEHGSLFDYLSKHVVTPAQMVTMALSIATGLAHLHMDIIGTYGKPGIAHRDLKSKNILVKRDLTCAIADLGLCVKHEPETDTVDRPASDKVGTRRYLAPEILDDSLDVNHFDSWKRADVFSLGLVLWELGRRTSVGGGIFETYQQPYFEVVGPDPTMEEMRLVVCEKQIRPVCSNRWESSEQLKALSKVIKECWYANAPARLTALRIKKTLAQLEGNTTNKQKYQIINT